MGWDFIKLDGEPNTLTCLELQFDKTNSENNRDSCHSMNCTKQQRLHEQTIHEFQKLPGGKENIFEHYFRRDAMNWSHQDIAENNQ